MYLRIPIFKSPLQFEVKFGLSEKRTKFEKNLPHGFDKSADLLSKRQNHEEDFFQIMCASQKVQSLTSSFSMNAYFFGKLLNQDELYVLVVL